MVKNSSNLPQTFLTMRRVRQETLSYCGPAVLQMLLSFQGVHREQREFVDAAAVHHKIKTHGMFINELARAINITAPELQFWYKHNSTIGELSRIVNEFNYPVAVEWQGVFIYDSEEEEDDDDPGHYSVVTKIDTQQNIVLLADPFRDFAGKDRKFTVLEFERRWWDINEVIDPTTGKKFEQDDYHTMFLVTPKMETFPEQLNMVRG